MTPFEEDMMEISRVLDDLKIRNANILITGATGLIGSVLVKALLNYNKHYSGGNQILALIRNEEKARNVFGRFYDDEHLLCLKGDVLQPVKCSQRIDYIIHAASETASVRMVNYPVETLWTAIAGSRNLLELAREKQVKGMVYLSSMEVFGVTESSLEQVSEENLGYIDIQKVRSCYPESKRMVENMCACYAQEYGVPVRIARLAQTFGAGVSKSETRVFAQFARSVVNKEDIVLHTSGGSYGNYVYTSDAAAAIFTLLIKGNNGEAYTVCNEATNMRIRDMAEMAAKDLAEGQIRVVYDIPESDMKYGYAPEVHMKLDASKMRSLGWIPRIGLREAYERLIAGWKESAT